MSGTQIECPSCGGAMNRCKTSSEPEGIRKDAACPECGGVFMVSRGGLVRIATHPSTPAGSASALPEEAAPPLTLDNTYDGLTDAQCVGRIARLLDVAHMRADTLGWVAVRELIGDLNAVEVRLRSLVSPSPLSIVIDGEPFLLEREGEEHVISHSQWSLVGRALDLPAAIAKLLAEAQEIARALSVDDAQLSPEAKRLREFGLRVSVPGTGK